MRQHRKHEATPPRNGGRRIYSRLAQRVLKSMMLVALLPLVIMAAQGYHCAREALLETTRDKLRALTEDRAAMLDSWARERLRDVRSLAREPYIADALRSPGERGLVEAARDRLESLLEQESYLDVLLFDARGRLLLRSAPEDLPRAEVDPSVHFAKLANGPDAVLLTAADPRHPDCLRTAQASALVSPKDPGRGGLVVGVLDLAVGFRRAVRVGPALGQTGLVQVVAPNGVAHAFGDLAPPRAPLAPLLDNSIVEFTDEEGRRRIAAASEAPSLGWTVVVQVERSEAFAWLGVLIRRALATGAATVVGVSLIALWVSRRLGRPLEELARVSARIRNGDASERIPALPGAEAETLRSAFNDMLDELSAAQLRLVRAATLASVGELTSSIAHEMRNPLSSVKINLQALKAQVENEPDFRELAEIASAQVARLEKMLHDLLQYGRPVELDLRPVRFADLARNVLRGVGRVSEEGAPPVVVADELGERAVAADMEQLTRAIGNLVENALQASPPDGQVALRAWQGDDGTARIQVSDQGPGLSPEARKNLFKPFFTTRPEGTGLGLANAKKIVELHGGSVSAEDAPGGGAAFTATLPVWKGSA